MSEGGLTPTEGGFGATVVLALGYGLKWAVDVWLRSRRSPQQKASDAAALDHQSVKTAGELMEGMRQDLDVLRKVVAEQGLKIATQGVVIDTQEREIAALKADHDKCLSDARQLAQKYESLETWLRAQGLAVPANKRPGLIKIEDGKAEMMTPATPARRRPRK